MRQKKGKRALRYASEREMPEGMRRLLNSTVPENSRQLQRTMPATTQQEVPLAGVVARPRYARHAAGEMNKTEAAYAQQLALRKNAGEIAWWGFESMKLRLAKATYLTVDFVVQLADGTLEMHEVKGRGVGGRFWAEEDARIKLKVAAEHFPFAFVVVWPRKGGGWDTHVV